MTTMPMIGVRLSLIIAVGLKSSEPCNCKWYCWSCSRGLKWTPEEFIKILNFFFHLLYLLILWATLKQRCESLSQWGESSKTKEEQRKETRRLLRVLYDQIQPAYNGKFVKLSHGTVHTNCFYNPAISKCENFHTSTYFESLCADAKR